MKKPVKKTAVKKTPTKVVKGKPTMAPGMSPAPMMKKGGSKK